MQRLILNLIIGLVLINYIFLIKNSSYLFNIIYFFSFSQNKDYIIQNKIIQNRLLITQVMQRQKKSIKYNIFSHFILINNEFFFHKIVCLLLLTLRTSQLNNINYIYSPFQVNQFDFDQNSISPLQIKIAQSSNLMFVAGGQGGIIIIDLNSQMIKKQFTSSGEVQSLAVTQNGQYLFFNIDSQLYCFHYDQIKNQLQQLSNAFYSKNGNSVLEILLNSDESTLYAVGLYGTVAAYDISNRNQISLVGQLNTGSNGIYKSSIFTDSKQNIDWLYLSDDLKGLTIVRSYKIDKSNRNLLIVGRGAVIFKTRDAVITNDQNFVYVADNWNGLFIGNLTSFYQQVNQQLVQNNQHFQIISIKLSKYWFSSSINPSLYSLKLIKSMQTPQKENQVEQFLVLGVRSQGMYILDISDRSNPILFQQIPCNGHAVSIGFNLDQSQLYFSNSLSIYVYQRRLSNFNDSAPNLFNQHQIQVYQFSSSFYKWRCYIKEINNKLYYFGAFDSSGFYINQINSIDNSYQLENINNLQFDQYLVESLQFFVQDSKVYMYVPVQINDEIMRIYDITIPENIQYLQTLRTINGKKAQYGESLFISQDGNYLLLTQAKGFLLIDSSDKQDLKIIANWVEPQSTNGEYSSVIMTKDNRWILGTIRGYGVFAVDASNQIQLNQVDKLLTLGAECLILSKYENTFAYLSDGMQGVAVVDLLYLPKIHIASRVKLKGWTNFMVTIPSYKNNTLHDNYIFVGQSEAGMLSVIDISNKTNIKLIISFQYESQSSQSICLLNNQNQIEMNDQQISYESFDFIFINNNLGVYGLPLKTQILIHSELIEVLTNGSGQIQYIVNNNTSDTADLKMYVGQDISLSLIPIYPILELQIVELTYFTIELSKAGPLPSWLEFDQNQSKLIIKVDKNALGKDKTEGFQNIILIKIQLPLSPQSFYYQTSTKINDQSDTTSQQDSIFIFNYLVEQGYIYKNGIITSKFTLDTSFNFTLGTQNSQNQALCQRVQKTFLNSIFFNPIYIYAYSSLEFTLGQIGQGNNSFQYLSTKSKQQITFQISIPSELGKFVNIPYNGVVSSLNSNQNLLVIQGTLDSINLVLIGKILFYCQLTEEQLSNTSYQVQVYIDDQMNYPSNINLKFSDCSQSFLNVQKQIKPTQQQNSTLQAQFNSLNGGSSIDITSYFKISFKDSAFEYPYGFPQIQYSSLYNVNDGEFQSLLSHNSWLQSSVNVYDMSFFGTPPTTSFRDKICVNITADNQYSQASDIFCFYVDTIPFIYILNITITIFGPLLGALGFWQYRGLLFNIAFRKRVTYSEEIVCLGYLYQKKIPILSLDAQKALLLFKYFISQYQTDFKYYNNLPNYLIKNNFEKQISQDLDQTTIKQEKNNIMATQINNQQIRRLKPIQDLHQGLSDYNNANRIEYKSSEINPISIKDIDNPSMIYNEDSYQHSKEAQTQQYKDTNVQVPVNPINIQQNNGQNEQIQTKSKQDKNKKQKILQLAQMKKKIINLIFQTRPLKDKFFQRLEQDFLKENGQIKMTALINGILNKNISFSLLAKQITAESIKPELFNKDSCLYNCLKYNAARYFLSLDNRSNEVYQYIKYYCQNILDNNQNDWYLSIIDIDPCVTQLDQKGNLVPFPKLQLKEDILNSILIDIQLHNQLGQKFHNISICEVNPYLIENVLFADALGILYEDPPLLYPSVGESLHLERQDILKVQAFKKIPSSYCMRIRKYLDMDYVPYSFSKINEIPNWLNLTISSNTLILEGIPQSQDLYDDILIRIIHQDEYIIRQFHFKIRDEFDPKKHQFEEKDEFGDEQEPSEKKLIKQNSKIFQKLISQKSKMFLLKSQFSLRGDEKENHFNDTVKSFSNQQSFITDQSDQKQPSIFMQSPELKKADLSISSVNNPGFESPQKKLRSLSNNVSFQKQNKFIDISHQGIEEQNSNESEKSE
ncbi:tetratricopeptide repeat protein (macronuclear) [Tetrahymena thermophila SB210]|uniref:Tetratricopeptide repeat protein n=1 Tax=Tetrahymena thermophila (strain SB210) TaxID=312017 RepID=I7ME89_TETTS|nr:tetratricopeptide repeat protein [Tetrahymena thermophila SB210]EAR95721.2 tetratricopeptide repeat protein [Tetrahymena thermophila SB210]|eukprot:XP_001015966.2 tetratricopeptide repeat protein [Tetrahymena thermophila SB210]